MELKDLQNEKIEFVIWLRNCKKLNSIIVVNNNRLFRINNISKKNFTIQEKRNCKKINNITVVNSNRLFKINNMSKKNFGSYVFKFGTNDRIGHVEICSESIIKFEPINRGYVLHMKDDTNLYISM